STAGFKRRSNAFSQYIETPEAGTETYSPGSIELNSVFDFSQGNMVETGRPLDFALYGKGFFVIETPNGPLYRRNGMFYTNQNGQIMDSQGRIVAGEAGPITIPSDVGIGQVSVSSDGSISTGDIAIGKFRLVDFGDNEDKVVPYGENCYWMPSENNIQPVAAENIVVNQGYQEASNVKIIDELVDMIMVSRLYEANMKFFTASMEVTNTIISAIMA
ncbi:MAG: flagellar hook basal-body protein, partial [Planctomycetota bacterium]